MKRGEKVNKKIIGLSSIVAVLMLSACSGGGQSLPVEKEQKRTIELIETEKPKTLRERKETAKEYYLVSSKTMEEIKTMEQDMKLIMKVENMEITKKYNGMDERSIKNKITNESNASFNFETKTDLENGKLEMNMKIALSGGTGFQKMYMDLNNGKSYLDGNGILVKAIEHKAKTNNVARNKLVDVGTSGYTLEQFRSAEFTDFNNYKGLLSDNFKYGKLTEEDRKKGAYEKIYITLTKEQIDQLFKESKLTMPTEAQGMKTIEDFDMYILMDKNNRPIYHIAQIKGKVENEYVKYNLIMQMSSKVTSYNEKVFFTMDPSKSEIITMDEFMK